ncbi:MAG: VWA domain-containing protein [Desulfobacteraceae bacterium]|nr:VWA domain-containing protein [Desulfobacteraceae bacterium]
MSKKLIAFILFLSFLMLFAACGEKEIPPPPKPAQADPVQEPLPDPVPDRAKEWPFAGADETLAELATDLTAKNYFLIFDGSGSMAESGCSGRRRKIDVAKEAVAEWSKSVPSDANLGVFAFYNNKAAVLPLSSGPRDQFIRAVNSVQASGRTPLTQAADYAFKELTGQARRQLGYGEYTIVVVTDGIANSAAKLAEYVGEILRTSPVNIYSIGFCIGETHSLNQPGKTTYKAADNPAQLREGLKEVLAESEIFDETDFSN